MYDDNKFLAGFQLRQLLFRENQHEYVRQVMDKLFTLYTDGTIKPVIDQVASFEDVSIPRKFYNFWARTKAHIVF